MIKKINYYYGRQHHASPVKSTSIYNGNVEGYSGWVIIQYGMMRGVVQLKHVGQARGDREFKTIVDTNN